jgi:hypothetical protein
LRRARRRCGAVQATEARRAQLYELQLAEGKRWLLLTRRKRRDEHGFLRRRQEQGKKQGNAMAGQDPGGGGTDKSSRGERAVRHRQREDGAVMVQLTAMGERSRRYHWF